jgi:hypothetical protein
LDLPADLIGEGERRISYDHRRSWKPREVDILDGYIPICPAQQKRLDLFSYGLAIDKTREN